MNKVVAFGSVVFAALAGCQDSAERPGPLEPTGADAVMAVSSRGLDTPANVSGLASEARIDVSWQDNSANETSFEAHRSSSGPSGTFTLLVTRGANVVTHSDQGLPSSSQYCYRVRAVRRNGGSIASYSAFSNSACATTLPAAPSSLNAVAASATRIELVWQDRSSDETGFEVHRSPSGTPGSFVLLATTGANVATYGDQGLIPLTQYCYQVRAVRVGSPVTYSPFSNSACVATPDPTPPAAASGARAVPLGSYRVWVSWTDNSTNEEGFRIYRSIDGGMSWDAAAAVGRDTSSLAVAAVAEQLACYRVAAFNVVGEAAPSDTSCNAPVATPWLSATSDSGIVVLTWSDSSASEDGYEVWFFWSTGSYPTCNADFNELPVATLPANATTFTTSAFGCSAGFYVYAFRDVWYSDQSNYVIVR